MKIILVHNTYQQNGGEDVVVDQERRLLERAGHCVTVYGRSNHEIENLTILGKIGAAKRTIWSSHTRTQFDGLLIREKPDLVHIHNTFMLISPSIYSACRDRNVPVVQTLHNFRFLCPSSNLFRDNKVCEECVDHSLLRAVQHACYRGSRAGSAVVAFMLAFHRLIKTWDNAIDCYIALTQFSRQRFISAGFPADKIVVKPNFLLSDPGPREQSGDYAVVVGRLSADKGIPTLLEAWEKLPAHYQLQIIGDGDEREKLEAMALQRGLGNVRFRGQLSRQETLATLKGARFLIMPSLGYETFGLVIIEAFACRIPAICSRLGAMQEIVEDQVTGLHFTPGNSEDLAQKVGWAWTNPLAVSKMGLAARRQYEGRYTAEKNYEMLMQIYDQTVRSHGRSKIAADSAEPTLAPPKVRVLPDEHEGNPLVDSANSLTTSSREISR
jgi:glycosyltransferase involved in cell wall biosynthesis